MLFQNVAFRFDLCKKRRYKSHHIITYGALIKQTAFFACVLIASVTKQ